MRSATLNARRPASLKSRLVTVVVVVAGSAGVLAILAAVGVIDVPFLRKAPVVAAKTKQPPPPGSVPVILAPRPIPAFTQVTRDHLLDVKTLDFVVMYLPAETVAKSGLLPFDKITGRVLAVPKTPGFGFTEKDFLPIGTRPGIVAGIPAGKRSFVLQSDRITGIQALQMGDHLDVLATLPVDFDKMLEKHMKNGMPLFIAESQLSSGSYLPRRAGVKSLVQNGVVVQPVTTREVPVPNAPLGPHGETKKRVVQEVTIAIEPTEVAPLTEALAVHAEIFCVAHSGLPGDAPKTTPGSNPSPRINATEIITGNKREVLIFTTPGGPPKRVPIDEEPEKKEPAAPKTAIVSE